MGGLLLGVIHGVAEIIVVAVFLGVTDVSFTLYYIMIEVGLITLGHHCVDYIVSLVVYKSCSRANLLENKFLFVFKKIYQLLEILKTALLKRAVFKIVCQYQER